VPPVYPAGVAKAEILHQTGEANFATLQCHVDVVRHEAESMDAMAIALHAFLEQKVETIAVFVIEEDVLVSVAAQYYMVQSSRIMNARLACHEVILPDYSKIASLTPFLTPFPK
jgi:hypothetical protein